MRALRLIEPRKFEIAEIDRPKPGEGQILMKVEAATVCNQHDLFYWKGRADKYPGEYGFPGHEASGVIAETGTGVGGLHPGDRVVTSGIGGDPLSREYILRRADAVAEVTDDSIPFTDLAPLELFGCVRRAVEWAEKISAKRVAVMGLGPAGLAAVMLLRLEAPLELVGIDLREDRRKRALEIGADRVIDGARFSGLYDAAMRMVTGGAGEEETALLNSVREEAVDVVMDCTGAARAIEASLLLAKEEVVIFGVARQETRCIPAVWFMKELRIKNSRVLSLDNLRTVAGLASKGLIKPGMLITHTVPFSRYDEALELVESGEAVKVALIWE